MNGLALLRHFIKVPDRLQLFDNTQNSTLIAELEHGQLVFCAIDLPNWVKSILLDVSKTKFPGQFNIRQLGSKDAVREYYLKQKKDQ